MPELGALLGSWRLPAKEFSLRKIKRKKGTVIKGTSSDTRLIHGIGNLTTTLTLKARITPAKK